MQPDFAVLIPASGRSARYTCAGGERPKLAETLAGVPVLAHAVRAFLVRPDVGEVVVASNDESATRRLLASLTTDPAFAGKLRFAPGGESRCHTVREALVVARADLPFVAVHDGARPMVSQGLIDRVFAAARAHGAAGPATPVHLTIKQAQGPLPAPILRTIPRQTLWAMQTPQAMRRTDLAYALDRCPLQLDQITDDLQLLELVGLPAMLVEGEEANLKITHPPDLELAARMLAATR